MCDPFLFQVVLLRVWTLAALVLVLGLGVAADCTPGAGHGLKYLWGDAMNDALNCIGPGGSPYPS